MKKFISITLALVMCLTAFTGTFVYAADEDPDGEGSGDPAETTETYATSEAYRKKTLTDLFDQEKLEIDKTALEEGAKVSIKKDAAANGLMISGSAENIEQIGVKFKDKFNFDENPVGMITLDALVDRTVKMTVNVYLDNDEDPVCEIMPKTQMGKKGWTIVKALSKDIMEKKLQGEHQVSLGFRFENVYAATDTKVLIRSIEFAESSIPVLYFNIDESLGTVEAMNADSEHDTECYGNMDIRVPEGYEGEFVKEGIKSEDNIELEYIRGRGNSTWDGDKKPYKIKFKDKPNLFGMGANNHWVLLANRFDNSLVRNRMTYWMTRKLGGETGVFAPECVPVEVVMNGDYYGSYLLTEQIRVDEERVAIDKLEKNTSTKEPDITGGYLLSKEYGDEGDPQYISTAREVPFYIESPDFSENKSSDAVKAQKEYLKNYLQLTEQAIFAGDHKALDKHYSEYMDIPAALDFWWIQEFSENGDAYGGGSNYLYKERDKVDGEGNVTKPGLLYWGPLWDFDYVAWGDLNYEGGPEETLHYTATNDLWMKQLLRDPEFVAGLKTRWNDLDALLEEVLKDGGVIDKYADEVRISQQYDVEKYGYYGEGGGDDYYGDYGYGSSDPEGPRSYDTEIAQLKGWISQRREWVSQEENLNTLAPQTFTITFKIGTKVVERRKYYEGEEYGKLPAAPKKKGYTFLGWRDPDGYPVIESDYIPDDNITVTALYKKNSQLVAPKDIFFRDTNVCTEYYSGSGEYGNPDSYSTYETSYTVVPRDAYGKIKWKTSDPSIGTVDSNGVVTILKPGKIKVTATLPSGKSKSYYLTIMKDGEYSGLLDSIEFKNSTASVPVGGYAQLQLIKSPQPVPDNNSIDWISTDTNILSVDDNGVVMAKRPGTAYVIAIERDNNIVITCRVTVNITNAWKIKKVKASKTSVKAKVVKKRKVKLSWKYVSYASGYYIYQASKAKGKYKKVATVKNRWSTSWTKKFKKSKKSKKYYFKVRAYIKVGKKVYRGKLSKAVKVKVK